MEVSGQLPVPAALFQVKELLASIAFECWVGLDAVYFYRESNTVREASSPSQIPTELLLFRLLGVVLNEAED
jgi:hypothetical protein